MTFEGTSEIFDKSTFFQNFLCISKIHPSLIPQVLLDHEEISAELISELELEAETKKKKKDKKDRSRSKKSSKRSKDSRDKERKMFTIKKKSSHSSPSSSHSSSIVK